MIRADAGVSVSGFAHLVGVPAAPTAGGSPGTVAATKSRGRGPRRWWTASSPWSTSSPASIQPGGTARSGRWVSMRAGTWGRPPACVGPWPDGAFCNRWPIRPSAARLSEARRAAFTEPPTRRNRVWQADFSQFETGAEGTWQLGGVVDYVSKVVLACPVTATQTAADLCAALDADTGELHPIAVVTDNGPAMKSTAVARWFEALKYKRLYRGDIADGIDLAEHVTAFTDGSNRVRTDEALGWQRPLDVHLSTTTLKPNPPRKWRFPDACAVAVERR